MTSYKNVFCLKETRLWKRTKGKKRTYEKCLQVRKMKPNDIRRGWGSEKMLS